MRKKGLSKKTPRCWGGSQDGSGDSPCRGGHRGTSDGLMSLVMDGVGGASKLCKWRGQMRSEGRKDHCSGALRAGRGWRQTLVRQLAEFIIEIGGFDAMTLGENIV